MGENDRTQHRRGYRSILQLAKKALHQLLLISAMVEIDKFYFTWSSCRGLSTGPILVSSYTLLPRKSNVFLELSHEVFCILSVAVGDTLFDRPK